MTKNTSVRRKWFAVVTLALAFIHGCDDGGLPVELKFGPPERAMLNRLLNQVDKGIETFDIRGKQAVDVFGNLPAAFGKEGAKLIEFQLTEWGPAMFGRGIVAVDCAAEGVQQRCIKNLEMVKDAIDRAVKKVNDLEKQKIPESEKKSKWATFLDELRFEPVLLDPYICYLDQESVSLQFTDATATATVLLLPSNGLLKARGTGLYAPRPSPDSPETRESTFSAWVVTRDDSNKETGRKDISSCILYTLDSTIQLNLNTVSKQIGVGDSHIEIVTKADPKKQVESRSQIPFVYLDPPTPDKLPQARVISLIIGGRTDGDDEDPNRGFHVEVKAGGSLVARGSDYLWGPGYKDADFPTQRFENFDRPNAPGWWLFREFSVPATGQLWVKASEHHNCECHFALTYTIQTYKWGNYDRTKKQFDIINDNQFNRTYSSPKHFFRGDEPAGTVAWDFNWEGQ